MSLKRSFVLILILIYSAWNLHAAWQTSINIRNLSSSSDYLECSVIIGEHEDASEAYDYYFDLPYLIPPMNPSYIVAYFPHPDWTPHHGNYLKDIRSTEIMSKSFDATLRAVNPYSANYVISWSLPDAFPDYYQPRLIHQNQEVDMRTQSSYSFQSSNNYSYFSIELGLQSGVPFEIEPLSALHYSDNLSRLINLDRHFGVVDGELSYALEPNDELVQSLSVIADSTWWEIYPSVGWIGETAAELSVFSSFGELSREIIVTRDQTNSPPEWRGVTSLEIVQNGSLILDISESIFDADRDEVFLSGSSDDLVLIFRAEDESLELLPSSGFKGQSILDLELDDGVNSPQQVILPIEIFAAEPIPVANPRLESLSEGNLRLVWDPSDEDSSGGYLPGIKYRVYSLGDPWGESEILAEDLSQNYLDIDPAFSRKFFYVKAINE